MAAKVVKLSAVPASLGFVLFRVYAATSETKEGHSVRPEQLSIYQPPATGLKYVEEQPGRMQQAFSAVRQTIHPYVKWSKAPPIPPTPGATMSFFSPAPLDPVPELTAPAPVLTLVPVLNPRVSELSLRPPASKTIAESSEPSQAGPSGTASKRVPHPGVSSEEEDSGEGWYEAKGAHPGEVSDAFYTSTGTDPEQGVAADVPTQDASFRGLIEKVAGVLALDLSSVSETDQSRFMQLLQVRSRPNRMLAPLIRELLSCLQTFESEPWRPSGPPIPEAPIQCFAAAPASASGPSFRALRPLASRAATEPSEPARVGHSGVSLKRVPRIDLSSDEKYVSDCGGEVEGACSGKVSDAFYTTGADSELGAKFNTPAQDVSFWGLLEKVANVLAFELSSSPEDQSRFLQVLRGHSGRSRLHVPLHEIIPPAMREICRAPSSVVPTNKRVDCRYLISEGEGAPLMSRPSAESTIASAANDRAHTQRVCALAPLDQEARKWDAQGKKVYASASLWVRISSYMAHFSQYDQELWSEVANLVESVPEDKRKDARRLAADGIEVSKALMQGALDLCDTTYVHDLWSEAASLAELVPQDRYEEAHHLIDDGAEVALDLSDTTARDAYAYLNAPPPGFFPRVGVIMVSGLAGLVLARKGSRIKKLLYPLGLTALGVSLCYPTQAIVVAKVSGSKVYTASQWTYGAVGSLWKESSTTKVKSLK
nr:PREDICTED: uncharacterized protein LOC102367396 [Latimeria chalumnae]|eukprot:XP_014339548.1 PREDICTED: uncharacterized protein LOC102367396 [Latimeria chalumnae]